jgi:hypothetical protein
LTKNISDQFDVVQGIKEGMEKPGKKEVTAVSIKPVEPFFEYITTEPYFNYLGVNLDCKLGNNTGVFQRVGEKVDLYTPGKKGVLGK